LANRILHNQSTGNILTFTTLGLFIISVTMVMAVNINLSPLPNVTEVHLQSVIPWWVSVFYFIIFATGISLGWYCENSAVHMIVISFLSMVVIDFWQIHSPFGLYEDVSKFVNNVVISTSGHFSALSGNFLQWPGTFLTGVIFNSLVGTPTFLTFYLAVYSAIFGILVYAVFKAFAVGSRVAFLASVMALEGNVSLAQYMYHPDIIVLPLVLALLLAFGKQRGSRTVVPSLYSKRGLALIVLLSLAITSSDFIGSVIIVLIIMSVALYMKLTTIHNFNPYVLVIAITAPLFWNLYWASEFSSGIIPSMVSVFSNPLGGFQHIANVYAANSAQPTWSVVLRLFWILFCTGVPVIISLLNVVHYRGNQLLLPSLVVIGVGITSVLTFLTNGVNVFLLLLYVPLVGAILVSSLAARARILGLIAFLLVILSVPSLLALNISVQGYVVPPQEMMSARFITSYSSPQEVFAGSPYLSVFDTSFKTAGLPQSFTTISGNDLTPLGLLSAMKAFTAAFESSHGNLLEYDPNALSVYYHLYGTDNGQSVTAIFLETIGSSDVVYSNGYSIVSYS